MGAFPWIQGAWDQAITVNLFFSAMRQYVWQSVVRFCRRISCWKRSVEILLTSRWCKRCSSSWLPFFSFVKLRERTEMCPTVKSTHGDCSLHQISGSKITVSDSQDGVLPWCHLSSPADLCGLVKDSDTYCHLVCNKACPIGILLFAQQQTFFVAYTNQSFLSWNS